MSIKTTLKTSVAAAALFAVSAPVVSTPAEAGLANGNDNGVVISGALNRSMQYVDNGQSNDWTNTDGGTDNSRLRILIKGKLTESIAVGGTWEANLPTSNAQGSTTVTGTGQQGTVVESGDSGAFGLRKVEVHFTHSVLGKLSIGQGTTSSDNKKSMDSTVNNNAGMSHGGGVAIYDKTANAQTANIGGKQFTSFFSGRKDRLRYDTPSVAGFQLSASMGNNNFYDAGLTYGATFGDLEVGASAQVQHNASGAAENYGGSVAAKHSSGLSASAHYGAESGSGQQTSGASAIEGSSWGVEAGYTTSAMSSLGATSFNILYTEADDVLLAKMQAESIQFHLRQKLPAGVEAYAAYEVASFDDSNAATSLDDISVFLVGTKLSF
jgi:hypothetical protein